MKNTTGDARVGSFLASDQQSIQLGGFSGITQARSWVNTYFGRGGLGNHVQAIASGARAQTIVMLTKLKTYHNALAKNCTENLAELNNLQKMLKIRSAGEETTAAGTSSSSSGPPRSASIEEEQQAVKKQRTTVDLT